MDAVQTDARAIVAAVVAKARAAQAIADDWTQDDADEAAVAAGWAIVEPSRTRPLASRGTSESRTAVG